MPVEQEAAQVVAAVETKKEAEALNEFIGGFENWSILIEDCRLHVAKFLDFKAAIQLEMCSKQDRATVEKTPMNLHSMEIENGRLWRNYGNAYYTVVRIQVSSNSEKHHAIFFKEVEEGTKVYWMQCDKDKHNNICFHENSSDEESLHLKECNHKDEAVKFFEKWLKICNYKINKLTVFMGDYPRDTSNIESLPNCVDISIKVQNFDTVEWWLRKCPGKLDKISISESLRFQNTVAFPLDFMDRPQVVNAGCLILSDRIPVTVNQFLNLKAGIAVLNGSSITDNCINQFIKNWVNGKCKNFTRYIIHSSTNERQTAGILQGVQQNAALSNPDQFFCDYCDKICGRGDFVIIPSLVAPDNHISVFFCAYNIVIALKGAELFELHPQVQDDWDNEDDE